MLSELGGNMNGRIKELYAKANAWALHNYPPPVNPFEWEDLRSKKFAELIVKECASICELNGQSYTHSFTPAKARLAESTSNHCGLMIKKHFGVGE
jgi:hypothetical protein